MPAECAPGDLHLIQPHLGLVQSQVGFGNFDRPGRLGLFERSGSRVQLSLGVFEGHLEGLLLDHEQELALFDVRSVFEMPFGQEAPHPRPDGHFLEGPRCSDGIDDDRHGHPFGLDDGHRGRGRHALGLGGRTAAGKAQKGRQHRARAREDQQELSCRRRCGVRLWRHTKLFARGVRIRGVWITLADMHSRRQGWATVGVGR